MNFTRRKFLKFLAAMIPASMLPAISPGHKASMAAPKVWTEGPFIHIADPRAKAVGIVHNAQADQAELNKLYSNSFNKVIFNSKDYGVVVLNDRSSEHRGSVMKWR
jgi:hypothetical protein